MKNFSLAEQIREVDRELKLRKRNYPRGQMPQPIAQFHMDRMRSVRGTLQWLIANETAFRAFVAAQKQKAAA
jgi:hypothetical protein